MFSRIQAWNSYMIGLFIQKSHFHPYSIHSWFANGKTFCLLCLQVKIRKLTRDQLSSLVRFKTTSLNWISLVMKVDPSLTFLIFLVSTTTKYFPVCVPLVSYCDGLKSTICTYMIILIYGNNNDLSHQAFLSAFWVGASLLSCPNDLFKTKDFCTII